MAENWWERASRIAREVQGDPEWRERTEAEQYVEYRRRVRDPEPHDSEEPESHVSGREDER
jgi:hypothetical protein